jgi:hypothetical protein
LDWSALCQERTCEVECHRGYRHGIFVDGQATFDEISRRNDRDGDFRSTVDRYIGDFERLLREAEQNDPEGRVMQNYMTSETGRVYLLLAHASGRLR